MTHIIPDLRTCTKERGVDGASGTSGIDVAARFDGRPFFLFTAAFSFAMTPGFLSRRLLGFIRSTSIERVRSRAAGLGITESLLVDGSSIGVKLI